MAGGRCFAEEERSQLYEKPGHIHAVIIHGKLRNAHGKSVTGEYGGLRRGRKDLVPVVWFPDQCGVYVDQRGNVDRHVIWVKFIPCLMTIVVNYLGSSGLRSTIYYPRPFFAAINIYIFD